MNRGLKIVLGIFGGLGVVTTAIGLYGRKILKNIQYSYGKPKIQTTGFLKPLKIIIPLTITNNNKMTLEIEDFKGKLFAGRRDVLSTLSIENGLELAQGETGIINFIAIVRLADLAGEVIDILESGELLPNTYILGKLKTNLITIPVYYKINYDAGVGEAEPPELGSGGELRKIERKQYKKML